MAQQSRDPWLDLAARRGVRAAPDPQQQDDEDPWTTLASKRGVTPIVANLRSLGGPQGPRIDPVTGQQLDPSGQGRRGGAGPVGTSVPAGPPSSADVLSEMNWGPFATRIATGLFGNSGGLPGAAWGGIGELAAQLQEGRFSPMEIAAEAGIGALPFASIGKSLAAPVVKGAGFIPRTINAASNITAGALHGGLAGGTSATLRPWIAEGRAPTRQELLLGTWLGVGGGTAGAALTRGAAKLLGGATDDLTVPSSGGAGGGQGGLFDAPVNPRLDPTAPSVGPTVRPPRILKGKDQYRPSGAETEVSDPRFASRRQPYIDPAFADQRVADPTVHPNDPFGALTGAQQMPLAPTREASGFDRLAELFGVSGGSPGGHAPSVRTESVAPDAIVSPGQRPDVSGQVGLMERMRETADMGKVRLTSVGEPEVLAPMRPGEERFSRLVGGAQSGQAPGAGMDPDEMVAELLGLPPRNLDIPEGPLVKPPAMPTAGPLEDVAAEVATLPAEQQAAVIRQFSELNPDQARELRRILGEMREFGFERGQGAVRENFDGTFEEAAPTGLLPHVAGAPVFHDIMGGTKGTRRSVIDNLDRFINQGGRPTAITQRTIDVANRRLRGDPELSRPSLPPDAGDVRAPQSIDDEMAALGAEPEFPPGIPDEISKLWASLRPKWKAAVDAQQGDGIPFTVDPSEDLPDFARRLVTGDDRSLMGAERQVVNELPPDKLETLRRFLQGDEEGSINPELARHLGMTAAGAIAGPYADKPDANPWAGRIGGAGLGLLASLMMGKRGNPRLASEISSSSLFSGKAIPKSGIGNVGSIPMWAAEASADAPKSSPFRTIGQEVFKRQTLDDVKQGWNNNVVREGAPITNRLLSYPGRAIGSVDYAARQAINRAQQRIAGGSRAPMPNSSQFGGDAGGYYTLSGDPLSKTGSGFVDYVSKHTPAQVLIPVARTATNFLERGLERTPGIGGMKDVRDWTGASDAMVKRRQMLGALAMLLGGGAGAAAELEWPDKGKTEDVVDDVAPFASAAASTLGLPVSAGMAGGRALTRAFQNRRGNDRPDLGSVPTAMLGDVLEGAPLPSGYDLRSGDAFLSNLGRRLVPYGAAMKMLSPIDPNEDLDLSSSRFGPALGQIPLLNEQLFPRKRKARPRVQFSPRQSSR